jgi:ribonuclease Z
MMKAPVPPQGGNKYSVSVLSTYSNDSSPSLLVTFPDQRYLFNTPEAISRIALQSKVGLRKVGNVFLGSLDESAGLPGFVLSSVEAGNNKIEIAGPAGTDHYLASCRFFTRR